MSGLAGRRNTVGLRMTRTMLRPLLLSLCLAAGPAGATAGLAEYSWYFPDRPGQWIEWNHGDVCPPEAPGKNCLFIRRSRASGTKTRDSSGPLAYPGAPRNLYANTLLALLPLVAALLGLGRVWQRWRQRKSASQRWAAPATWAWGVTALLGLAWSPDALRVLFPASPDADGWHIVIGLAFNIAIVIAPFTLWVTYRRLFPPPGSVRAKGWRRAMLWPALLLSALLAPELVWGPPNLLLYLFPPAMLPNIAVSMLAVWAVSKAINALAGKPPSAPAEGADHTR
jgi:hypothetical protein